MFKIDKSFVEYFDSNKSYVVIKHGELPCKPAEPEKERLIAPAPEQARYEEATGPAAADEESARRSADLILSQAMRQSEEIRQTAYSEGYEKGMQEAREETERLRLEYREGLQEVFAQLQEFREKTAAQVQGCIVALSLEIAEKIINIRIEKDDIIFVGLVKKAIQRLNTNEKFVLRLNQREYDRFFSEGGEWLARELQCAPFTVVRDTLVAPGGCVLESQDGIIKAGVDAQMQKIAIALENG